jgi:uncharacterized protein
MQIHFRALFRKNVAGRSLRCFSIAVAMTATALSAQAQERASVPEPGKAVTAPLIRSQAVQAGVNPLPTADEVQPATKPPGFAPKAPEQPVPHIALLLPLASKTFGKVAEALKQGFVAGAEADGKNAPPYRIYASDDEGASLAAQYRKAASDGAVAIIGGVTRDGAGVIARESRLLPTLALNAPSVSTDNDLPDRFFYISLSLDLEARSAARMASGEGLRSIAILVARNPLAQRIQESFEKEWLRLGGEIAAQISFGTEASDATRIASTMEKLGTKANAVFLAADPAAARTVRPYLPAGMPVFATSHSVDPHAQAVANLDLDNVRFLEMPWFAEPDHAAVMAYAKPAQALPVEHERLYALGIDAWRLVQLIVKTEDARKLPTLDGVTGKIANDGHQLTRTLSSVEIRNGKSALYRRSE